MSEANFDFDLQKTYMQDITVENTGDCALVCYSEDYMEYCIDVKSVAGQAFILKFGPIMADIGTFGEDFVLEYKTIKYNDKTINREIQRFITAPLAKINQVNISTHEEILSKIPLPEKYKPEGD